MTSNKGYGHDPDYSNRQLPWELTLNDVQIKMLEILGDIILPEDELSPKASDLNIVGFLNEWLSAPYQEQKNDRRLVERGLEYLDSQAIQKNNRPFLDLSSEEQEELFSTLSDSGADYNDFFDKLVRLFVGGYYTTDEGMKDIGYVGNQALPEFKVAGSVLEKIGMEVDD